MDANKRVNGSQKGAPDSTAPAGGNPYAPPQPAGPPASASPADTLWSSLAAVGVCGLPLIHYGYVWLFWWTWGVFRGEPIQPGLNDPSDCLGGWPYTFHIVLLMASFSVGPLAVLLGLSRRRGILYGSAYVAALVLMIVLFRLDYWQLGSWISD